VNLRFRNGPRVEFVFTVRSDGTRFKALRATASAALIDRATWSPDGRRIAYSESAVRGHGTFVIGAGGTGRRLVVPKGTWADWAPDGRLAVGFATSGGGIDIVRADGTGLQPITASGTFPVWSPDGTRIAYVQGYPAAKQEPIAVVPSAGGAAVPLTAPPPGFDDGFEGASFLGGRSEHPWSPDGTRLLFKRFAGVNSSEIDAVAAAGGAPVPLATSAGEPAWSPDGRRIAYTFFPAGLAEGAVSAQVWVMNADGSGKHRVATRGHCPAWSPDGQKLAFTGEVSRSSTGAVRRNAIYTVDLAGAHRRQLTPIGSFTCPAWRPT
jgi:Tol biopolymer transport system component